MDEAVRRFVRHRATYRCEYCRLPQAAAPFLTFHVEHIQATQHRVDDSVDNLALACPDCNRHKGPNLATLHPRSGTLIRLFHPRRDVWEEHFVVEAVRIVGRSEVGTATVRLLRMNTQERLQMRAALLASGNL